jgi:hypothetical protein
VYVIVSKEGLSGLIEWHPTNKRLIMLQLWERVSYISILQCYPPNNDSTEEKKDNFHFTQNTRSRTGDWKNGVDIWT